MQHSTSQLHRAYSVQTKDSLLTGSWYRGHSGVDVKFPRVLGIEAVGEVEEAPGGEFKNGDAVGTCMGGMGRIFDGKFFQYADISRDTFLSSYKFMREIY